MNTQQAVHAICAAYYDREPLFLWGPPGIGKSEGVVGAGLVIADQLVKDKKIKKTQEFGIADFRMAQRDPTDIKGFPMPDQATRTMKFYRDGELPTDGYGILFMDELVSAAPATQAAAMQLTLRNSKGEFAIGDYVLPKGWAVIAAGNRETDRGVVHRMPTPLANRFTHLDLEADKDSWVQWALDHGVSAELIAWIRFKPDLLFKFDPKSDSKAFPTPRSWVRTEKWANNAKLPEDVKIAMIRGTVGDGPGSEYWAYRRLIDQLPTLDEIRLNPTKAKLPGEDQPSARFAVVTLMGAHANEHTFEAFLQYSERLDKEFQVVFVKDALHRDSKIERMKIYTQWALKNSDVIL